MNNLKSILFPYPNILINLIFTFAGDFVFVLIFENRMINKCLFSMLKGKLFIMIYRKIFDVPERYVAALLVNFV